MCIRDSFINWLKQLMTKGAHNDFSIVNLLYVGRATAKRLEGYGIHTIGDIARTPPELLHSWFGVNGLAIWKYASGTDTSRVMHKDFVSPVKSIGHGITCTADLEDEEEVWKVILELSQDIGHRLRVHKLAANGVQIAVRSNDLSGRQFQCQLPMQTQSPMEIAEAARDLFCKSYRWSNKVRAITVRAINLRPKNEVVQMTLFTDVAKMQRREKLDDAIEEIRRRFGKKAIYSAALMGDLKMPGQKSAEVIMPGIMYR